ncbi:MAG TPA: hypothetical protein VKO61_01225 [Candidatus Paceibacterota bacterium]|nr:hypothetical protein [Candidatus Paceibacterota bacterium]
MYEITFTVGDKEYKSEAETIEKALESLEPEYIKFRGRITAEKDDEKVELQRLISPSQYKRLKLNEADRKVIAKNIKNLFS